MKKRSKNCVPCARSGVSREKLLDTFGGNYLPRLERLEAAEMAKRSDEAKIIKGETIDG